MSVDQDFTIARDLKNEVVRAERVLGTDRHQMEVVKGISNWKAYARMAVDVDGERRAVFRASLSVPAESAALIVQAGNSKIDLTFDFSRYDGTQQVFVSGRVNSARVAGTFDPRTGRYGGDELDLDATLSDSVRRELKILSPVFAEMRLHYDLQRQPHEPTIEQMVQYSMGGSVGRAACWGFAGLGAAAACAGTFGFGCAGAAFVFAAAASVCSDQY